MRAAPDLARLLTATVLLVLSSTSAVPAITFTDVTTEAGVYFQHGLSADFGEFGREAGGVAAGDYDRDGWVDLYVIRGDVGPNLLFRNRGDGTFEEVGAAAGVQLALGVGAGPTFADYDGDGWLDLLVLGNDSAPRRLLRNQGDGTFEDVTATSGIVLPGSSFSAAFGDYDRDGDLDLAVSRWGNMMLPPEAPGSLWRNDGGHFVDVSQAAGLPLFLSRTIPAFQVAKLTLSFTPNFVDIDSDGWPDLLMTGDFDSSTVLRNRGDGTFADETTSVITDQNGMGAAIGDVDNDGDLDWFVSSIFDPNGIVEGHWGITGNRFYRNDGAAGFSDQTDAAGVRVGYWGWGSTFADLDNDGDLDLFHTNGWYLEGTDAAEFENDPSRLFVNQGGGVFVERSQELGIVDTGQGRGVVAFDYDRDGDLDLFVTNNLGPARLLRNDGGKLGFLVVKLRGAGANSEAIGARVSVTTGAVTQMRELRAGSNFESQDPVEAHFGLGKAKQVDAVRVQWPDGTTTVQPGVAPNQRLLFEQAPAEDTGCSGPAPDNDCTPGRGGAKKACLLEWRGTPTPLRKKGAPGTLVSCAEGDPTCDSDPDLTNASCTIRAALCVHNVDPRFPKCAAAPIEVFAVTSPKPTKPGDAADVANRAELASQFQRLAALATPGGAFVNVSAGGCVEPGSFAVPLKVSKNGKVSAGARKLQVVATTAGGKGVKALVQLQCRPAGS